MAYLNNASDIIFEYLANKIQEGEWKPGDKIDTEDMLCQATGASKAAVRQGIERMCALGVLKKLQGSGTYVNRFEDAGLTGLVYYPPTVERMLTVLEFREHFDSANARMFALSARDDEIRALRENYTLMCECENEPEKFWFYENDFHERIASGTHNTVVKQIALTLTDLIIRYQKLQYDNIGPKNSIIWHARILEALEKREAEMAELCVRTHLEYSIDYIRNHYSSPEENVE